MFRVFKYLHNRIEFRLVSDCLDDDTTQTFQASMHIPNHCCIFKYTFLRLFAAVLTKYIEEREEHEYKRSHCDETQIITGA